MSIDATSENIQAPGRLVNHSKTYANMNVKMTSDKRLYFGAKNNINAGSQLLFDYNDNRKYVINDNIWLKT